ncbi:MAG: hypothetical protein DI551_10490 [Micavibrio aeruginosavorus]|uniref:OmpA-like domain-containing protein n=1 Tax=Micavibrio aeruginosavorus TaxID=349221 RepID=A0A2W5N044_9BACT|nr:MAG: hypothetical protein DI551_10490 [Micavibrio aeruginosavorus]
MISGKFSNLFKLVLSVSACAIIPLVAQAQDSYAPPPMFDDMTPPMVRPQATDGYIVTPKASVNTPLPQDVAPSPRPAIITPRVSIDPDSDRAKTAVPTNVPMPTPSTAPVGLPVAVPSTAPSVASPVEKAPEPVVVPKAPIPPAVVAPPQKPKMMEPIVEETYIKRQRPVAKTGVPKPVQKPEVKIPDVRVPEVAAPLPPEKPIQPMEPVKEQKVIMPAVKATPAAIADAPKAEIAEPKTVSGDERTQPIGRIKPVERDPKESAIKGPKTMPALPTADIDQQVVFEEKTQPTGNEETIFERNQREAAKDEKKEETLKPVGFPKKNVTPASFDKGEQGALKKSVSFQPGQVGLSSKEIDPIAAGVSKELDEEEKKDWRVQIRAYASPYGTGVSSDKRIALSRALSLRTALISQGISASRIDVMAEGAPQDGGKNADRIDLYLYGPSVE